MLHKCVTACLLIGLFGPIHFTKKKAKIIVLSERGHFWGQDEAEGRFFLEMCVLLCIMSFSKQLAQFYNSERNGSTGF